MEHLGIADRFLLQTTVIKNSRRFSRGTGYNLIKSINDYMKEYVFMARNMKNL